MTYPASPAFDAEPAGPERRWSSFVELYYGILIPPFLWAFQESLNFGLASHACFPDGAPSPAFIHGMGWVWWALLGVNLVCLIASAAGMANSYLLWRRLWRDLDPSDRRREDVHNDVLAPGEPRVRVFAAAGFLISLLFSIAILFNSISIWTLGTCSLA
ncbi:MAG TPA: hypothetical protein VFE63_03035 [Roseiarcus sp.]|jgi:hypothetical protein|nr:hypothetical protein [Roseiarcus sp.]